MGDEDFLSVTLVHLDLVHNLARRLVPTPEAAEDLVQETFLRALRGFRRRRPDDVAAWLATICLNTARSSYRRAAVRPDEVLSAEPAADVVATNDTAAEALAELDRAAVRDVLWRLPDAQREAVTLMDLCGFTAAEVATMTGVARGTVLARVHRGHKTLARLLPKEVLSRDA